MGQLMREQEGSNAFLIGFSSFVGTVTTASTWYGPVERKQVRPALPESYEHLFHQTEFPDFILNLRNAGRLAMALKGPRLERSIGVVYLPRTERQSHYLEARLSEQFDAIVHFDQTRAVEPLEVSTRWRTGDSSESYPAAV